MSVPIFDALKGISGNFEVNRVVGAAGALVYIVSVPAFVCWNMHRGAAFDLVAFCAAYPAGLGVAIGAIAGAVAIKDRNVATAQATQGATDAAKGSDP